MDTIRQAQKEKLKAYLTNILNNPQSLRVDLKAAVFETGIPKDEIRKTFLELLNQTSN